MGRREVVAALIACALAPSAAATRPEGAADADWPLRLDAEGRPLAPVTIGGRGPWDFVVDSAATRTLLTPDLAAELGLAVGTGAGVEVRGTTGSVRLPLARIGSLRSGSAQLTDADLPVLPRYVLPGGGILGVDALAGCVLDLDFAGARCAIRDRLPALRGTVELRAARRLGGAVAVTAAMNAASVLAIVDTGTGRTLGNAALARLAAEGADARSGSVPRDDGPAPRTSPRTNPVRGIDRAQVTAEPCVLATLRLARAQLPLYDATCADAAAFTDWKLRDVPALLLGMDALASFDRVAIDFARGTMHVRRGSTPAR